MNLSECLGVRYPSLWAARWPSRIWPQEGGRGLWLLGLPSSWASQVASTAWQPRGLSQTLPTPSHTSIVMGWGLAGRVPVPFTGRGACGPVAWFILQGEPMVGPLWHN